MREAASGDPARRGEGTGYLFQNRKAGLGSVFDMDPRIKLALQVMCESRVRDLTVADVAYEVGLSASRFEHILKDSTGQTFTQHKRSIRVRQAKRLLQDWHLSLKQIAYLTGYSSPSSFSRAFRNSVRRSPSQFRMTIVR